MTNALTAGHTRRPRWWAFAAVAVLATAGCGGSDRSSSDDGASAGATGVDEVVWVPIEGAAADWFDADLLAQANALSATFGSARDAGAALLIASARGYDTIQILDAVDQGTLTAAGRIIVEGTTSAPANEPTDVIVIPAAFVPERRTEVHGLRSTPNPGEANVLFDQLALFVEPSPEPELEAGALTLGIILGLFRSGYSAEQIVEFIVFGDQGIAGTVGGGCGAITSLDGTGPSVLNNGGGRTPIVWPANRQSPECIESLNAAQQDAEDEPLRTAPPDDPAGDDGDEVASTEIDAASYRIDPDPRSLATGEVFARVVSGAFDAEPVDGGVRIAGSLSYEDILVVSQDAIQCTVTYEFGFDATIPLDEAGATVPTFIRTPTPLGLDYAGPLCGDPIYRNTAVEEQGGVASQALPLVVSAAVENGTLVGSFAEPNLDFTSVDDVVVPPIGNLVRTS